MSDYQIVTLLSDFGLQDVYVGTLKGAIARVNPRIPAIDLNHDIPPQNLLAARFCLLSAYPYFPKGTVHIAVVDPGVGSQRRAIAIEFPEGYLVGPDNGIFSGILDMTGAIAVVELTNPNYWLTPSPSNTFHGRDIFAPVGAYLASGTPLAELGKPIDLASLVHLSLPKLQETPSEIVGCVQYIDRFGNAITNIPSTQVEGKSWHAIAGTHHLAPQTTYSNVRPGNAMALIGSHGWIEIAVNCGSASKQLHLNWQAPVTIAWTE